MEPSPRQLPVPHFAHTDPEAFELARVWSAGGGQCVSLKVDPQLDPAAWGILLVDLARHAALAYEQRGVGPAAVSYQRILAGFVAEVQGPTDEAVGPLVS